MMAVGC